MRANVEIRSKLTIVDKKGKFEQVLMQVNLIDYIDKGALNEKKIEVYFERDNIIVVPLPTGELLRIYIDGV